MLRLKICRQGATRVTLLAGRYAFKFPTVSTYALFIEGIRANLNEGRFVGYDRAAPIAATFYSNKFGLLNVQQRVRPVINACMFPLSLRELLTAGFFAEQFILDDPKPCNFGYAAGNRLVKLDYGN